MEHMTPLDAAFLEAEDEEPGVSLAISSTAIFEGPPPDSTRFSELIAGRLPMVPRYRQKVREVPLDLASPVWIDDEHFDLGYHLRRTALPAPGGDAELATLIGRVMSARLDRDRPLWEYWLVEGLSGGRWALISKVHHCMVDGVSGSDLYQVILDESPQPRPAIADDWRPNPEPGTLELVVDALLGLALNPVAQLRMLAAALGQVETVVGQIREVTRGLSTLSEALRPADASSLSGSLSAHRRFTWRRVSLDDVRVVRRALGGTVNDVVLAAITGGFRTLLLARGETPHPHSLRSLVPVNVRAPGEESIRGNQVSMMLANLPVHLVDPVARLNAVRAHLDELKAAKETESVATLVELSKLEPFPLLSLPYRVIARLPQRSIVTVTTNVPGPQRPLYALGRRLLEIIPYVPIASTVRTGVSIFSYCGELAVGVTGDYDAAADVDVLARGIDDSMAALVKAAAPVDRRGSGSAKKSSATGDGQVPLPRR